MKVRVIKKCYIGDRVRKPGCVIELKEEHMNKNKEGESKLPSWAEAIDSKTEEKASDGEKGPEPTTLHEIAEKKIPKVSKPAKKNR